MSNLMVKRLSYTANLPFRATAGAAGYDLSADENCIVPAHGKALVSTGLVIAVPKGCYGRVAPRSSLASKYNIHVGAGVVDEDYRGPVKVLLLNLSDSEFRVQQGDRIAQLILEKITIAKVQEVKELDETERGVGGFGSTGIGGEKKDNESGK
jgi:deoxyuridine 5'-triphosphate nucleotidohydrolase